MPLPVLFIIVLATAAARADVIDPNIETVPPRLAFPGVEKHRDAVFLLHVVESVRDRYDRGWHFREQPRLVPIEGPEVFAPELEARITRATVLAVPRKAYEKMSPDERAAIGPDTPGVAACTIEPPRTSWRRGEPRPGVLRYRVALDADRLTAEPVAGPADGDSSATGAPFGPSRAWWGVALAASIAWFGIATSRGRRPAT